MPPAQIAAEVAGRFAPERDAPWLPEAVGLYEEEWLEALLGDLADRTGLPGFR
jgi:hypothetical protein